MHFTAETAEATKAFARRVAERLTGGELLLLEGDLGAGKTTFVQGLAEGLGAEVGASSPTFVLERRYPGRLELVHLDLYRLEDEREVRLLVREALSDADTAVAVEWADKFPAVFTEYDAVRISFTEEGEARELDVRTTGPASEELVEALA